MKHPTPVRDRILSALRYGPLTHGQIKSRLGSSIENALADLVATRQIIRVGGEYMLTDRGQQDAHA